MAGFDASCGAERRTCGYKIPGLAQSTQLGSAGQGFLRAAQRRTEGQGTLPGMFIAGHTAWAESSADAYNGSVTSDKTTTTRHNLVPQSGVGRRARGTPISTLLRRSPLTELADRTSTSLRSRKLDVTFGVLATRDESAPGGSRKAGRARPGDMIVGVEEVGSKDVGEDDVGGFDMDDAVEEDTPIDKGTPSGSDDCCSSTLPRTGAPDDDGAAAAVVQAAPHPHPHPPTTNPSRIPPTATVPIPKDECFCTTKWGGTKGPRYVYLYSTLPQLVNATSIELTDSLCSRMVDVRVLVTRDERALGGSGNAGRARSDAIVVGVD
uniref:Uncharacterized protein n=1 Tax=Mycena chlorophos TaxID=658473 RepID=A0ABQ0LWT8_MYCCL|nr:predicted protein [Mycena chlorophos]